MNNQLKMLRTRAEWLRVIGKVLKHDKAEGERLALSQYMLDAVNVAEQRGQIAPHEARDIREWMNAVTLEIL